MEHNNIQNTLTECIMDDTYDHSSIHNNTSLAYTLRPHLYKQELWWQWLVGIVRGNKSSFYNYLLKVLSWYPFYMQSRQHTNHNNSLMCTWCMSYIGDSNPEELWWLSKQWQWWETDNNIQHIQVLRKQTTTFNTSKFFIGAITTHIYTSKPTHTHSTLL